MKCRNEISCIFCLYSYINIRYNEVVKYHIEDEFGNTPNVLHFHGQNKSQLANTFRIISQDHIVDVDYDKTKLTIVSTWTDTEYCCLLNQCEKFNIPLVNCVPENYDNTQQWYMPNKIQFFINTLEKIETELVMFLDGYDVLFLHLDDIIKRYKEQKYTILFGPSCNNYPDTKVDTICGRISMGTYRYFNAGCVIGERNALLKFYKEAQQFINVPNPWNSEQLVMRYAFAKYSSNKNQTFVGIDYKCNIFRSMGVTDSNINEKEHKILFSINAKQSKNIIVTGSDGFIGKYLVTELKKDPANKVFEVDRKNYFEVDYIELLFIKYDIDIVFHLAAQTSVFNENHLQVVKDNIDSFVKIVDLCEKYGTKLVYASSSTANIKNTTSIYGLSKRFDEEYAKLYSTVATGVRLHNVYHENNPREGTLMWHVLNDNPIKLWNNGNNIRHFTHVNDAVNGLIKAVNSNELLVNCYDPKVMTTLEFVKEHNVNKTPIVLLNEVRDRDKYEQEVDETITNILNAEN